MADEKPKCSGRVHNPNGSWGRWTKSCSRAGVVERDGKLYCRQHDPEAVKKRRDDAYEVYRVRRDAENEAFDRQRAAMATCDGIQTKHLSPGLLSGIRSAWGDIKRDEGSVTIGTQAARNAFERMTKLMASIVDDRIIGG